MAPGGYYDTTAYSYDFAAHRHRGEWYVVRTTCTTSSTATVSIDSWEWYYTGSTANYVSIAEPLPKCETDSQIQLARMAAFGVDPLPPVRVCMLVRPCRRAFRHLARGKLRYWRSLNEKRMAWRLS